MAVRREWWVVVATVGVAACTSLSGLAPDTEDAGSSVDASPAADATPLSDADVDAPSDGGSSGDTGGAVNLVKNPGFEQNLGSGCTDWIAISGTTAVLSNVAHSGAHSCLVCPTNSTIDYMGIAQFDTGSMSANRYYAEVWLSAPPNDAAATPNAGVVLYETLPDGAQMNHQGSFVPPSSTWGLSTVDATVVAGNKIELEIHGYFPAGGCVLVDDVALYAK